MSPMCWLSQAYLRSAMASVFLRSAPTASVGGTDMGSATGRGAYPRERRIGSWAPSTTRTTESSHGTRMSLLCISQPSARCESRSSASSSLKQMGSPPRLPEVITNTVGPGSSPPDRRGAHAAGCRPS